MPPRPGHIPHNGERSALQMMSATEGLTVGNMHPVGKKTIAGMVAKGWIERSGGGVDALYCITEVGQEALRAKIPA
jgi:hypothetical protein